MSRLLLTFTLVSLLAGLSACTKNETTPKPEVLQRTKSGFDTHWKTETQFIVESTVIDLAGMAYFASRGRALDGSRLEVDAREIAPKEGKPLTYQLRVSFPAAFAIETIVPVTNSIWAPEMYRNVVGLLFNQLQIDPARLPAADDIGHAALRELTGSTAAVVERENEVISAALEKHFLSPALHEQAALVLVAFTLREHSGLFSETRSEQCRIAAHLAFAQALRGNSRASMEGQFAAAALAMFYDDQRSALQQLSAIAPSDLSEESWVRALRIRITGDYRLAAGTKNPTLLERREEFAARVRGIEPQQANRTLPEADEIRTLSDWSRILNEHNPGVGIGHEILARSLGAEINEAEQVYLSATGEELGETAFIEKLNAEPGPCVTGSGEGPAKIKVIGWGLWAAFLQRHLCLSIQSDFAFLQNRWGVPDQARKYRESVDEHFSRLRLFPFLMRQNATEASYYRQAQDASMAVVHHSPHLVPVAVWNEICYKMPFADLYIPPPHAYVNEWHRFNPPPGTAYDIYPRFNHPSLTNRKDFGELLTQLHEMAPYDNSVTHYYLYQRASPGSRTRLDGPSLEQGYAPVLDYSPGLMAGIADAYKGQTDQYEHWMSRAAALQPVWNYALGDFYVAAGRETDAAHAFEKIVFNDPDSVRMSGRCDWLVQYYDRTGATEKATSLAKSAAEVYSQRGLETMARLMEKRGDFTAAIGYHQKIEERYGDSGSLVGCLLRYERVKGKNDYAPELRKLVLGILPRGLEQIGPAMLAGPPKNGTFFKSESAETRKAGIRLTDIIVGVRGYKVNTFAAYDAVRDMEPNTPFKLLVWRNGQYIELSAAPPNNRFGVDMGNYTAD